MVDPFLSPPMRYAGRSGARSEARILRDRMAAYEDAVDRASAAADYGSARLLVQVYNGGSMPAAVPRVYLTHPVLATGTVSEGASASLTADTETTVPVVVLNKVPSVGDYLVAYSAGGRWVSEETGSGGGTPTDPCSPCPIPEENLTLSWTNLIGGNGSTTMTYSSTPSKSWTTGCCDGGIFFQLLCTSGGIELRAYYFTSGSCPTGTTAYCSNLLGSPNALTLSSHTCGSGFSLTFSVTSTGCPTLFGDGNTQFAVTK
jgi:hypothetical protein